MSEHDEQAKSIRAVKKINVSGTRLGTSEAPIDIQKAIQAKTIAVVRSHNTRVVRKGAELLKVINLVGLGEAGTDELIGRLLFTQEMAQAEPERAKAWAKAGETLRLQHNPLDRDGVFSVVVQEVDSHDAAATDLADLGLKFNPRYASFEGAADIHEILMVLEGTRAFLRVRVGRQSKAGDSYIVLFKEGQEVEGARAILLGLSLIHI